MQAYNKKVDEISAIESVEEKKRSFMEWKRGIQRDWNSLNEDKLNARTSTSMRLTYFRKFKIIFDSSFFFEELEHLIAREDFQIPSKYSKNQFRYKVFQDITEILKKISSLVGEIVRINRASIPFQRITKSFSCSSEDTQEFNFENKFFQDVSSIEWNADLVVLFSVYHNRDVSTLAYASVCSSSKDPFLSLINKKDKCSVAKMMFNLAKLDFQSSQV